MKIQNQPPQTTTTQQVDKGRQTKEARASRKKAAEMPAGGDNVQLSSLPETQLEAEQAQRVQAIKEQVKSGKYRVDARAVAEKLVSGKSGR
ncbi:flagellar biosynthesis anti-sigma factor FlgM [Geomonas sp.]|uniref:flagellar biosynthesis anti-sigma factor FlgM n=1 Tax=Geomonas sp. TaxID=2651584 RepID=UPI002B4695E3|nr:flagellar biosynthesis anti-sigma factor FlgM [Geomonas sp.]HJV35383.1 flagellar biosynthesis anti-sigma factor FlgM [Geomonas sp.]